MTTAGEEVEILLTRDPPYHAKLGGGCGVNIKKQYTAPLRPLGSHSSGSWQSARNSIAPISVPPYPIDDSIPTDEEVEWEVHRLRGHRSGGPSWIHVEHLWEWLKEYIAAEAAT